MKNWNINQRVLFICLFPLTIIAIILTTYFTSNRVVEIQINTAKQGKTAALHLAASSEYGVISGNIDYLSSLTKSIISNDEITGIVIKDSEKNTIFSTHTDADLSFNQPFEYLYKLIGKTNKPLIFTEAISPAEITIDDYEETPPNTKQLENAIGWVEVYMSSKLAMYNQVISIIKGVLIAILVYLFSVYLSFRLSDEISRAISNISQTVKHIESGHLGSRAFIYSGDELGKLAKGINNMASTIQESDSRLREKIDNATLHLRKSYEEIEKQNRKLIQARQVADSANRAKSNFLANISHEIRTPINGILGFINILQKTTLTPKQLDYLQTINHASNSLVHLVDDLLDFARIESGKMKIESISFDFYTILENVYSIYSNIAFSKGLELLVNVERIPKYNIISDPVRIEQLLTNLISNAIKFTDSGHILISIQLNEISKEQLEIHCTVKDTGIGLDQDSQERIFDEFEQGDSSVSRKYGGTGLGLAITKNIATLLNGSVGVESVEGSGSTFWFTLRCQYDYTTAIEDYKTSGIKTLILKETCPEYENYTKNLLSHLGISVLLADKDISLDDIDEESLLLYSLDTSYDEEKSITLLNDLPNKPIRKLALISSNNPQIYEGLKFMGFQNVVTRTINRMQLLNIFSNNFDSAEAINIPIAEDENAERLTFEHTINALVVDDNDINTKILEAYLKSLDVNVITVNNGQDAVDRFENNDFDIVFMDVHMPVMNGYETTHMIRNSKKDNANIPIIGITADGLGESNKKAIEFGMNQCLVKPVSQDDIEATLQRWMQADMVKESILKDELSELDEMLLGQLPEFKDNLSKALHKQNTEEIYNVAHKLLGGALYCNIPKLTTLSESLQNAAKKANLQQIQEHAEGLSSLIDEILVEASAR